MGWGDKLVGLVRKIMVIEDRLGAVARRLDTLDQISRSQGERISRLEALAERARLPSRTQL